MLVIIPELGCKKNALSIPSVVKSIHFERAFKYIGFRDSFHRLRMNGRGERIDIVAKTKTHP